MRTQMATAPATASSTDGDQPRLAASLVLAAVTRGLIGWGGSGLLLGHAGSSTGQFWQTRKAVRVGRWYCDPCRSPVVCGRLEWPAGGAAGRVVES